MGNRPAFLVRNVGRSGGAPGATSVPVPAFSGVIERKIGRTYSGRNTDPRPGCRDRALQNAQSQAFTTWLCGP
jgi:hypothetical protein